MIIVEHHKITGPSTFYNQTRGLKALINSDGYLEVALGEGSATGLLGSRMETQVKISRG